MKTTLEYKIKYCPECKGQMENKGNIDNIVYTSYPAQWDQTYVCSKCKVKEKVRVHETMPEIEDFSDYKDITQDNEIKLEGFTGTTTNAEFIIT